MSRPSSWPPPSSPPPPAAGPGRAALLGEALALLLVLAAAGYLRFTHLAENPGWYSDEGTIADIAQNMAEGKVQYLALGRSTLLAARLPLMPGLLSLLLSSSQNTLLTLRTLTASLGVLSSLLLYLLVRTSLGPAARATALLAGLLQAVYPFAVFYNRIGFSYNLLTPLLLIAAGGFWFYLDRGRKVGLAAAALAIGLGAVTDLMMISLTAPFVLIGLVRRRRDLLWGLPLLALPFGAYAVTMLLRDAPAFLFDVQFTLVRLTAIPWWAQLPLLTLNLGTLALTDPWWIPAVIGLLLLRPPRWRLLMLILLFLPLLVLGRSSGLAGLRRYSISPLFPLVALGMANLMALGLPWMLRFAQSTFQDAFAQIRWLAGSRRSDWLRRRLVALGSAGTVFLLGLTPLLISTVDLVNQVQRGFHPENDWAYVPARDAAAAAALVNRWAAPTDLVLASPAVAWTLDAQAADFQQALAFDGQPSVDYPPDIPPERFIFEAGFDQAAYVIVDRIWMEWGAVHIEGVADMLELLGSWNRIGQQGDLEIYARERP
ncbi:MAG TPA: glycosyltransferase family 39 protein [Anaerolineales bacterium]